MSLLKNVRAPVLLVCAVILQSCGGGAPDALIDYDATEPLQAPESSLEPVRVASTESVSLGMAVPEVATASTASTPIISSNNSLTAALSASILKAAESPDTGNITEEYSVVTVDNTMLPVSPPDIAPVITSPNVQTTPEVLTTRPADSVPSAQAEAPVLARSTTSSEPKPDIAAPSANSVSVPEQAPAVSTVPDNPFGAESLSIISPTVLLPVQKSSPVSYRWTTPAIIMSAVISFEIAITDSVAGSEIYRNTHQATDVCSNLGDCIIHLDSDLTPGVGEYHLWQIRALSNENASLPSETTFAVNEPVVAAQAEQPDQSYGSGTTTPAIVDPDKTIYVSLTGSDSNSGRSSDNPVRSIQHASNIATPGDTIFVKAGNYGAQVVEIRTAGSLAQPITIAGYTNTPGDAVSPDYSVISTVDSSLFPVFDSGSSTNQDFAVSIYADNIVFKNFHINRYRGGLQTWGVKNVTVENVLTTNLGNPSAEYDGYGIMLVGETQNSALINSTVINAFAQAISVSGDNNLLEGNSVFADDDSRGLNTSTDYFFLLTHASNNLIRGNRIERVGELPHPGHGFSVKHSGESNIFENNHAVNIAGGGFVVRHKDVKNNIFRNNTTQGGQGIMARDGAHDNLFESIVMENPTFGIRFANFDEDPNNHSNIAGSSNTFNNITINGATSGAISFFGYGGFAARSSSNVFDGLIVNNTPYLMSINHHTDNNIIRNSTLNGVSSFAEAISPFSASTVGISFSNTTTNNSGFSF